MDTATMDAPTQAGESIASRYFRRVTYETHAPSGTRRLKGLTAVLGDERIDDARIRPLEVAVVPPDLAQRIAAARQGVRSVIKSYTLGTRKPGVRLVALQRQDDFFALIAAAIAEFDAAANEAAHRWQEVLDFNRGFWRPKFATEEAYQEAVGRKLPRTADEFRDKFGVAIADEEPDRDLQEVEDVAAMSFLRDCVENGRRLQEQLEADLRIRPLADVAAAAKELEAQLATGKKLTPATFTSLAEAVGRLRQCAQFTDAEAMRRVEALGRQVGRAISAAQGGKAMGDTYTATIAPLKGILTAAIGEAVAACDAAVAEQRATGRRTRSSGLEFLSAGGDEWGG